MTEFESYVGHNLKNFKRESISFENLPHDIQIIIFSFVGFTPRTNGELREAVKLWISDESEALKKYGHISYWNTQFISDMMDLFLNAESFYEPLNWDTKNVTNMEGLFYDAKLFNQPLNWDTKNVTNMSGMLLKMHNHLINLNLILKK